MAFLRYQTVRSLGLGALGAGAVAGIVVLATGGDDTPAPAPVKAPATQPLASSPPPTPPAPVPKGLDDAAIAARADQPANAGEKIKDAFKGNPIKVNLYEETQDRVYDRLKIDADRDDVWDQQWTRDASGHWKREDGRLFVAGAWVAQAPAPTPTVAPATTPETPTTPATPPAEPFAAQLETIAKVMLEQRATSEKIKDYFRGNGPKVNIYDDDKDGRWDRAKVDYDRDEVDDDKLTVKNGYLERKNEKSGVVRVWDNGAWRAK